MHARGRSASLRGHRRREARCRSLRRGSSEPTRATRAAFGVHGPCAACRETARRRSRGKSPDTLSPMHAVVLIDPKFPHNVGNALRACAVFGASRLVWTGDRVAHPDRWTGSARLPREERMKAYKQVELGLGDHDPAHAISTLAGWGCTPVA